jgi:hypothetical protein
VRVGVSGFGTVKSQDGRVGVVKSQDFTVESVSSRARIYGRDVYSCRSLEQVKFAELFKKMFSTEPDSPPFCDRFK